MEISSDAVGPAEQLEAAPALKQESVQPTAVLTYMVDVLGGERKSAYKGEGGCVGVLGGSNGSCSPPYFAAMSALRAGADIARIFTTVACASCIQTFSPDIFVSPVFREEKELPEPHSDEAYSEEVARGVAEVESWFSRLHCLIVGSGLGRDRLSLEVAERVIKAAIEKGLPLVLDGDAIFLVARNPGLIMGYHQCVITPNLNEYRRFAHALGVPLNKGDRALRLKEVVLKLQGPTVLSKGPVDAIANLRYTSICDVQSSARRCCGQGDVVAGIIGAIIPGIANAQHDQGFVASDVPLETREMPQRQLGYMEMHHITHMACVVARQSAARTYEALTRSMLTTDILPVVGRVLSDLTPSLPTTYKKNASSVGWESDSDMDGRVDRGSMGSLPESIQNRTRRS